MNQKGFLVSLKEYLHENKWFYLISLLFLFTGIVIGIYVILYMGDTYKQDISSYFLNFADQFNSIDINKEKILLGGLKSNLIMIGAIIILGIIIVGVPIIFIINIIKGFTIGFSTGVIINSMGLKGGLVILASIVPQNLLYVSAIIITSVFSCEMALNRLKSRLNKNSYGNKQCLSNYIPLCICIGVMLILGAIIEAYFIPTILKYII
ncbi:stage II sporulation protein M [Clostridium frigidicarnis]|uniref:Stage II sporulation protein M n=1 Tax=Clostridium frigidicarnis TaxID=84698 RepID=A0A1I0WFT6_9CLOT|nr:stage II sporulation protein M [Clostridium frigidicarnis]SFA87501.1 stage II sporulation protein M [Clostridium frigidicarnis]